MTPQRWSRIQDLFEQALALPPDRRLVFLRAAAAGDDDLLREVASLLDADGSGHSRSKVTPSARPSSTPMPSSSCTATSSRRTFR